MTQENRLRDRVTFIIADGRQRGLNAGQVSDAILSAVRESLPTYLETPDGVWDSYKSDGWNAYRKEMLKLLGEKDDGE